MVHIVGKTLVTYHMRLLGPLLELLSYNNVHKKQVLTLATIIGNGRKIAMSKVIRN